MLRVIIGSVTLAAIGYGVKKCNEADSCSEAIEDGVLALAEATDNLEDKLGLNEWSFDLTTESTSKSAQTKAKTSTSQTDDKNVIQEQSFHTAKKELYAKTRDEYMAFMQNHNLTAGGEDVVSSKKIKKEKVDATLISDEIDSYRAKILSTLDILTSNVSLAIRYYKDSSKSETVDNINHTMQYITKLAYLKLFDKENNFNKTEVLSVLVDAMSLTSKKDNIHVNLF